MALWLFKASSPLKPISADEERWAQALSGQRLRQFRHSRGYMRHALADLWNVDVMDIPLIAMPGKSPQLKHGWGCISLSHCRDALLIGWSPNRIGVDLERCDRSFSANQLALRYFSSLEKSQISELYGEDLRASVLEKWLIKEAAIKWQEGSLAADLVNWQCSSDSNYATNIKLGYQVAVRQFQYSDWRMAIAVENNLFLRSAVLCIE